MSKGNERKKPGSKMTLVLLVGAALVGLNLDRVLALFGISFESANVSPWLFIPGIAFCYLFVLSFHEAGHVFGGKLVGFRFMLFIVGPIKLYGAGGRIKLGLNRSLLMAGGLGGAAPTDSRNLARRMMAYVAGGPAASLVLAASCVGLTFVVPPSLEVFIGAVALMSFFIGAVTLIPNRMGGFVSDGARIKMLRAGDAEAERWCAMSALYGALMAGTRPRDLDEGMIGKSLSPADGSHDEAGARSTAHYRALDLGKVDEAQSLLEPALDAENIPVMTRSQILLEAAFLQARFRRNPEEARILSSEAKPNKVMDKSLPPRVEAATLLAEGDANGAKEKAADSLEKLDKSLIAGTAKLEREWLEEILADAGTKSGAKTTRA